ncbi:hypothetical protein HLH12_09175 [Acinetobacter sp. NIPH 2377]|uniref:hypothetical protein n=1 Tax=Acinetobacter terrestris TaxID=2529843 RepID=UPI00148F6818|nr:hypothetical protein [Acinetobacter terrestris]NNH35714.1 hypothetical protein [Acinetobacter terrestris]
MAILDHSLPLQVKAPDMMGMLDQGSQLAQFYTQQKSDGELNRLYKETNGDLDKMMEIGKTSPMARFVMPQLQAQKSAQQKSLLDQQKIEADIGKTQSEAFKNNQQGGGFNLDNTAKLMDKANQALYVAAQSGDANAVKLALNNAKSAGLFNSNPEAYNQYFATAEGLSTNPEGLKSFALSLQKAYAQNPEKYNFTTADNVLDNETSITNNTLTNQTSADNNIRTNQTSENNSVRTAETSRYSTDVGAQTAANKLTIDQAKIELEQKKGVVQQFGDSMYMVYPNGSAVPISSAAGPVTKNTTAPAIKQAQQEDIIRTQRVDAVLPEIKKLLEGTKGGYINAGLDMLGGAAGYSTDTAKTTAQLKALSGQLVALMPKMSGPQSDKDVQMYREMAGNLADPTTPVATRLASLQTIQTLNDKYKELNGSQGQGVPYANASSNTQPLSGAQNQGFQSLVEKHTR